jgi:hypothetical protein
MIHYTANRILRNLMMLCLGGAFYMANAYTISQYYTASWAGSGAPATIVANSNGTLPMSMDNCPADADMATAAHYVDLLYDGVILGKASATTAHTGEALVIDWNYTGGWITAMIAGTYHWQVLTPSFSDTRSVFVFWIKGAVGGEQANFQFEFQYSDGTFSSKVKTPVIPVVTTQWQRVAIPVKTFVGTSTKAIKALQITTIKTGKICFFLDQMYFSTKVPATEVIPQSYHARNNPVTEQSTALKILGNSNGASTVSPDAVFNLTGQVIGSYGQAGFKQANNSVLILFSDPIRKP